MGGERMDQTVRGLNQSVSKMISVILMMRVILMTRVILMIRVILMTSTIIKVKMIIATVGELVIRMIFDQRDDQDDIEYDLDSMN